MDRIHENAQNIVDLLLENEAPLAQEQTRRSCGHCEREFGVHDPEATHGVCKRHSIEHLRQAEKIQKANYSAYIAKIEAKPDAEFPPDLSKPENAELRASLGPGKTQAGDNRLEKVRDVYFPRT